MTIAWMLWTVLVSACVALAARALEEVAHLLGRPLRWVWAAALAGSAAAPVLAHLALRRGAGGAGGGEVTLGALAAGAPDGAAAAGSGFPWAAGLERLDGFLLAGWAAASVAILLLVALAALAFALRRRGWQEADVDGHRVLLTRDVGPAVAGLLRGRIVLPAWALQLAPPLRTLMLEHEAEHLRAGDPRLLGGGLLLVALLPWNPVAWWQLRRLRLAIEVDCDARVLRRRPDARTYGDLLLAMGARTRRMPLAAAAAFSEPRTTLETRIRKMIDRPARPTAVRLLALLAVSAGAIAFACEAPSPQDPLKMSEEVAEAPDAAESQAGLPAYTTAPRMANPEEVEKLIETSYPPMLLNAGMGGQVDVSLYVGRDGRVEQMQLKKSSGYEALDKAAMKVAGGIRFEPAEKDGEPVAAWVSLPIRFDNAAASAAE
ncbi:MAG: M56 family metallopeptidase, partial [Gemmatimonadota bacterium]